MNDVTIPNNFHGNSHQISRLRCSNFNSNRDLFMRFFIYFAYIFGYLPRIMGDEGEICESDDVFEDGLGRGWGTSRKR